RFLGDDLEQLLAELALELDVVAPKRQRGAVDRGEGRTELVRNGCDEVLAHALERALLVQVAERVYGSVLEADGRHREPELPVADLERDGLRPAGLARPRHRQPRLDVAPARHRVRQPP